MKPRVQRRVVEFRRMSGKVKYNVRYFLLVSVILTLVYVTNCIYHQSYYGDWYFTVNEYFF